MCCCVQSMAQDHGCGPTQVLQRTMVAARFMSGHDFLPKSRSKIMCFRRLTWRIHQELTRQMRPVEREQRSGTGIIIIFRGWTAWTSISRRGAAREWGVGQRWSCRMWEFPNSVHPTWSRCQRYRERPASRQPHANLRHGIRLYWWG